MEIFIRADLDYVMGHLRYGHKEGFIDIPKEDLENFKDNPVEYLEDHNHLICELDTVIDDYEIDGYGDITNIDYKI